MPTVHVRYMVNDVEAAIAFYTSHRRVWAQLRDGKLALGGAAHRNSESFGREFDGLCAALGIPSRSAAA